MIVQRLLQILLVIFLFIPACTRTEDKEQPMVFKQVPEIRKIQPEREVKIRLKRSTKGEYSWDISGDDTEEIIKTDKKLRESLKEK